MSVAAYLGLTRPRSRRSDVDFDAFMSAIAPGGRG
jgi:hypothetical protein